MADWIRDEADYAFRQPGQNQDTKVHVTGVMDSTEMDRPKLLIENRWDNSGPSVQDSPARDQCIARLSAIMKVNPNEVDWYTHDESGQLQSVSIGYERKMQADPEYAKMLNSGEFYDAKEEKEAKKLFPDVAVETLRTTVEPANSEQKKELATAFTESHTADRTRLFDFDSPSSNQKSTHEYDLSQERLHDR